MRNVSPEVQKKRQALLVKLAEVKHQIQPRSIKKFNQEINKGRMKKLNDIDKTLSYINVSEGRYFSYQQVGIVKEKEAKLKKQVDRENNAAGKIQKLFKHGIAYEVKRDTTSKPSNAIKGKVRSILVVPKYMSNRSL